jgi:hypothetical protein
MDDDVRAALTEAADAVEHGPARLHAAIRLAADRGERPAAIVKAIGHVYTYDYVARLVREHRRRSPAGES